MNQDLELRFMLAKGLARRLQAPAQSIQRRGGTMAGELSRIERATLQKVEERGGSLRIDTSNPGQRGLHWLLNNLAERGYVRIATRTGTFISYQSQPRATSGIESELPLVALRVREHGR